MRFITGIDVVTLASRLALEFGLIPYFHDAFNLLWLMYKHLQAGYIAQNIEYAGF